MSDRLRVYAPEECGADGYPLAWHASTSYGGYPAGHALSNPAIKDLVRLYAGHRCQRCGHPYRKGEHGNGEWSMCDDECRHGGTVIAGRCSLAASGIYDPDETRGPELLWAQWRILTVHHLNGDKADCRWWNLAALCQRCHLTVQGRVVMERAFVLEHSEWMKPYAAGFYAVKYLDEDLTREETMARVDELLALELMGGVHG